MIAPLVPEEFQNMDINDPSAVIEEIFEKILKIRPQMNADLKSEIEILLGMPLNGKTLLYVTIMSNLKSKCNFSFKILFTILFLQYLITIT